MGNHQRAKNCLQGLKGCRCLCMIDLLQQIFRIYKLPFDPSPETLSAESCTSSSPDAVGRFKQAIDQVRDERHFDRQQYTKEYHLKNWFHSKSHRAKVPVWASTTRQMYSEGSRDSSAVFTFLAVLVLTCQLNISIFCAPPRFEKKKEQTSMPAAWDTPGVFFCNREHSLSGYWTGGGGTRHF